MDNPTDQQTTVFQKVTSIQPIQEESLQNSIKIVPIELSFEKE